MNGTHDIDQTKTHEDEGGLDPREAARLLERTRREAQRKFDLSSPLLSLLGAAVVLLAFGAVWLSVRGQHPYKGPTAAGLLVMYGILICWIGGGRQVQATRDGRRQRALGAPAARQRSGGGGGFGRRVRLPGGAEARRGESRDRLRDLSR